MKQPLVSIITPCYNGETYLNRYFESILAQTYSNIELIFINDGSTDRTEEIALSYAGKLSEKGIHYIYERQENAGQAAALNRGLKLFAGKYLTWPDSDDIMKEDCIEKKVDFLEKNSQYGLCICKTEIVNEDCLEKVEGIYQRSEPQGHDNFFEDIIFLKNVYFTPGGYMVRLENLLTVIPERNIYTGRGGQNAQILLPLLYTYKCGYMKEVLNTYVVRAASHSHLIDDSKKIIQQLILYEKILIETLKNIDLGVLKKYEGRIRKHYAKLKFGNAIDSEDKQCIKTEFCNLWKCRGVSLKSILLFLKKEIF